MSPTEPRTVEAPESDLLSGLPVLVVDERDAWPHLDLGPRLRLGSFEWRPRTGVARETVASGEALVVHTRRMIDVEVIGICDQDTYPESANHAQQSSAAPSSSNPRLGHPNGDYHPSATTHSALAPGQSERPDNAALDADSAPGVAPSATYSSTQWYRRPYVYLFIVTAPDIEGYRESGPRRRLRGFIEACLDRKAEYLVIYAPSVGSGGDHHPARSLSSMTAASAVGKRFGEADDPTTRAQKKVLEKIKTETNTVKGKDRTVVVRNHHDAQVDLIPRLKELLRDAVEARVFAYEDEIFRVYSNRLLPGWSFYAFFALKEGLSFVYGQLGRRDMALRCYDELAATMTERDERGNEFGGGPGDDAAPGVVDPCRRPYRKMIAASQISELNFRTYLFARQATLLLAEKKYAEFAERGKKFISYIARRAVEESLRDGTTLPPEFRDAWTFAASRALVSCVEPAVHEAPKTAELLNYSRDRNTARLVAGFYVQALKSFSSLAAKAIPEVAWATSDVDNSLSERASENAASNGVDGKARTALSFTSEELRQALSSVGSAEEMFSTLTNNAVRMCILGGRPRGAMALSGNAGRIRLRNSSLAEAEELLGRQCTRFHQDGGWDALHRKSRIDLAEAEKGLEKQQEYLVSCLSILSMCRRSRGLMSSNLTEEETRNAERGPIYWAAEAENAARSLPHAGFKYKMEKLLVARMEDQRSPWSEGDPGEATVVLVSDIPASLHVDAITVSFRVRSKGRTMSARGFLMTRAKSVVRSASSFNADTFDMAHKDQVEINEGETRITVKSREVPWSGRYVATSISLLMGKLKLVKRIEPASSGLTESDPALAVLQMISRLNRSVFFVAKQRPDSVVMEVFTPNQLFFVPEALQYLAVSIKAGPTGLDQGAAIEIQLLPPEDAVSAASLKLLGRRQVEREAAERLSSDELESLMEMKCDDDAPQVGEIVVPRRLEPMEELIGRIAVVFVSAIEPALLTQATGEETSGTDRDSVSLADYECGLEATLVGAELAHAGGRRFECTTSSNLQFCRPIALTANVQRYDTGVAAVHCKLFCRHMKGDLFLKDAHLSLPSWGTVQTPLPHADLVPAALGPESEFDLLFEMDLNKSALKAIASTRTGTDGFDSGPEDALDGEHAEQFEDFAAEDTNGIVRVELSKAGVHGDLVFEGMVELSELISTDRRFIVTTTSVLETTVGIPVEISFEVQMATTERWRLRNSSIVYSVEIEQPDSWLIAGRQRGEVLVSDNRGEGKVRAIPLTAGRLLLPRIVILQSDGTRVDPELVVNRRVGEQVWVLPPTHTLTTCRLVAIKKPTAEGR